MKLGVFRILLGFKAISPDEVIKRISKDRKRMRDELNPEALQHSEVGK